MAQKRKVRSSLETRQHPRQELVQEQVRELVQEQVPEEQIEPQGELVQEQVPEEQIERQQIEPHEEHVERIEEEERIEEDETNEEGLEEINEEELEEINEEELEEINEEELKETNEEELNEKDFDSFEQEQDLTEQPHPDSMDEYEKEIEDPHIVAASNGGHQKSSAMEKLLEEEQEPVEKLIESYSKEQLVVLLKEAISKYPEFIESLQKLADADPAHRKIFVHGLGWDTNVETLTSEFSKYGEVEDCKAVTDKVSGKSKGYGFILFKHRSGAQKALKEPQKKIGNRMTSCQLASAGPLPTPPLAAPLVSEYTQRKIFVSNVSADIEPWKLVEFFSKFGEIEDGPLGLDKQTGKPKGFALFVYKTTESAKRALEEPHKSFEGHTLHCQRAVDGPKPNKTPYHQQHQLHRGYHHHAAKKTKYSSGGSGGGHLMAPSGPTVGFNPAVAPAGALTPALGQALTTLLATQGAGLGINNLLGGLGAPVNQGIPSVMNNAGYGNQGGNSSSGYGSQPGMQGGYLNPQMGQGSIRPQQGGGFYMGRGH